MAELNGADDTIAATTGGAATTLRAGRLEDRDPRGMVIGRYVVVEPIGSGGMGVVMAAYDPELDRKVAIKLLHRTDPEVRSALLREAQAMAKLDHPNTVTVHELGEHDGRVFLAMEFVEGQRLDVWLREAARSLDEIVAMFVQTGRGLAAAHAKGIVHRDFKPANVIVGNDGRPRVADFGIARTSAADARTRSVDPDTSPAPTPMATTVVGTPAYMAPEQHRGEQVGPAADQFSFCVTLFEALYGVRPFAGPTAPALAEQASRGDLQLPPNPARVPKWLDRIVRRGLSPDAATRWPAMDPLLDALSHDPTRRRRRLAALGLGVLAVAGVLGAREIADARAVAGCEREAEEITAAFGPEQVAALRSAAAQTGWGAAGETVDLVMPRLEEYAASWADARRQACLAATVERSVDAQTAAATRNCLDERLSELDAIVGHAANGERSSLVAAVPTIARLLPVSTCTDPTWLAHQTTVSDDPQLAALRDRIARHRVTIAMDPSVELDVDGLVAEAREHGDLALELSARLLSGQRALDTRDAAEAETVFSEIVSAGGAAALDAIAAEAATALVYVVGVRQHRHTEAQTWGRIAGMWLDRMDVPADDERRALLLDMIGQAHQNAGAAALARTAIAEALAIRERVLGPEHPIVAVSLHNLAATEYDRGAYDVALDLFERALESSRATLGERHPTLADTFGYLAAIATARGEPERAVALLFEALRLLEAAYGADHPAVARAVANLGSAMSDVGRVDEADAYLHQALAFADREGGIGDPFLAVDALSALGNVARDPEQSNAHFRRALAILQAMEDPPHARIAITYNNLALAAMTRSRPAEAVDYARQAVATGRKIWAEDDLYLANALGVLGDALYDVDEHEEAGDALAQAIAIRESALGRDHVDTARLRVRLAAVLLATGDATGARAILEGALPVLDAAGELSAGRGKFLLARALDELGEDPERASELAEAARERYRTAGPTWAKERAAYDAWLVAHGRPPLGEAP